MRNALVRIGIIIGVGLSGPIQLDAQVGGASPQSRETRLVQHSPHFDEAPKPWGSLSCPAAPLTLIGFENESEHRTSVSELSVRVLLFRRRWQPEVIGDGPSLYVRAIVSLTPMPADLSASHPPEPGYAWLADSAGHGSFRVPPGDYVISVRALGMRGGNGVLRLHPRDGDSLRIYIDTQAICDAQS